MIDQVQNLTMIDHFQIIELSRMLHFIIILYHDWQSTAINGYEPIRLGIYRKSTEAPTSKRALCRFFAMISHHSYPRPQTLSLILARYGNKTKI